MRLSPPHLRPVSWYSTKSWLTRLSLTRSNNLPVDRMSAPDNRQGFLSNLSPWGSRAGTPKPPAPPKPETSADKAKKIEHEREKERVATGLAPQQGGDHIVDRRHRLSLKRYPQDCPPLAVRWFHAIDVSGPTRADILTFPVALCSGLCLRFCKSISCMQSLTITDPEKKTPFKARHGT